MNGKILHFDPNSREGIISGDDGNRYRFIWTNLHAQSVPLGGESFDITTVGTQPPGPNVRISVWMSGSSRLIFNLKTRSTNDER